VKDGSQIAHAAGGLHLSTSKDLGGIQASPQEYVLLLTSRGHWSVHISPRLNSHCVVSSTWRQRGLDGEPVETIGETDRVRHVTKVEISRYTFFLRPKQSPISTAMEARLII